MTKQNTPQHSHNSETATTVHLISLLVLRMTTKSSALNVLLQHAIVKK